MGKQLFGSLAHLNVLKWVWVPPTGRVASTTFDSQVFWRTLLDLWHSDKQRRSPMRHKKICLKVSPTLGATKVDGKKMLAKWQKSLFYSFIEGKDWRKKDLERLLYVTCGEKGQDWMENGIFIITRLLKKKRGLFTQSENYVTTSSSLPTQVGIAEKCKSCFILHTCVKCQWMSLRPQLWIYNLCNTTNSLQFYWNWTKPENCGSTNFLLWKMNWKLKRTSNFLIWSLNCFYYLIKQVKMFNFLHWS